MVVICKSCNYNKKDDLDLTNPKTLPLLEEAIKKYKENLCKKY